MSPVTPSSLEPLSITVEPDGPDPVVSLECNRTSPEPVETPTPEEMLTSPPRPFDDELDPALICTDPPLPAVDVPTLREMLPADPPLEVPVDTTTEPEDPVLLDPLPRDSDPVVAAPDPLPSVTEPLESDVDTPDSSVRLPDGPELEEPDRMSTDPDD